MIVRHFWRNRDRRSEGQGVASVDAFWVEATLKEAEAAVFAKLQPAEVDESRRLGEQSVAIAKQLGRPPRPYCFLVARDLSSIEPFIAHYPISPMWNAYSPFEPMRKRRIRRLEELAGLQLPKPADQGAGAKLWWKFWA